MKANHDRSEMDRAKNEYKAKDKGVHDADSLRMLLVRKYSTMTAAWKHGLDPYNNGKLSFMDFCSAMRRLGFSGDIHQTFNALDTDRKGAVTLRDLDEEAHKVIAEFRELLLEKYGTYDKGFKAMDTDKNGTIEANEMVEACAAIGYSKDPDKLFKYLRDGPGKRNITMADLDPAAMEAFYRGDMETMSKVEKARANLIARQKADRDAKDKLMEAKDWRSLKQSLIRKFGTITSAWRNILDVTSNGKVSFVDFSKRVRDFGFSGDIKQIFHELDSDDSGIITFNEVDQNLYGQISMFNELLLAKYLSYETAWYALDGNHNNMVELDEFVQLCDELGYPGSSKALFRQLLKNPLRKCLTLEDMEGNAMIIQGNKADANSSGKFYKKADSMLSNTQKAKMELANRKEMARKAKSLQTGAESWPQLKDQLTSKYGTITAAWRHGLDISGNGKVSYTEFCAACRNHGFQGDISQCFKDLDTDGSGIVTFNEIDPDWFARLNVFKDLIAEKYGNFEKAWKALDANKNNMLECEEFAQVCYKLGYQEDPRALFKQLLGEQGRRSLTPEDIEVCSIIVPTSPRTAKTQGALH